MAICVFVLKKEGDYLTLDVRDTENVKEIDKLIAEHVFKTTGNEIAPGSVGWFKSEANTAEAAVEEARDEDFGYADPKEIALFSSKLTESVMAARKNWFQKPTIK